MDRAQLRTQVFGLVFAATITTAIMLGLVGVGVIDKEEIKEERAIAEAYCEQVYNDSDVYTAMVVGDHGGLHCVENQHGPHYHDIKREYKLEAYNATQHGTDLGWTVADAKDQQRRVDEVPLIGLPVPKLLPFSGILLVSVAGVLTIAIVQRYRRGPSGGETDGDN